MTELKRPNPDELLTLAQEQETAQDRGKLKIFFGAAPGVGKTYTMLQDAKLRRQEGIDVVLGIVESHGRPETKKLIEDFELLPRLELNYRGKVLEEFALDQALARHPAIIIVDEMAHSNVEGSRHRKRWQDIKELIDRGIDVYTTLNVQHVESLNDIVAQITGVRVQETVPDSIIDEANIIELVDLSPDDLLRRMDEGNVYIAEQAKLATQNFFRKSNLVALRELALRFTAERVNSDLQLQRISRDKENIWATTDRLLVCISSHEDSSRLVRATRRLAVRLQAEWTAIYVESSQASANQAEQQNVYKNLRLAEQLGAQTTVITGLDVIEEIIEYAHLHNITKIIIGKSFQPRWKTWLFGSLVDKLVQRSKNIDIYIIHDKQTSAVRKTKHEPIRKATFHSYMLATIIVAAISAFCLSMTHYMHNSNIIMLYLLGVVLIATRGRRGPATWASIISVVAYDFLFIPPRFSFVITDVQYIVTLAVMLGVSQLISYLTVIAKEQTLAARARERYLSELNNLDKQLSSTWGLTELLKVGTRYLSDILDAEVSALVPDDKKQLYIIASAPTNARPLMSEKENSVAQWVYELGQPAGLGTETLPYSEALYLPLIGTKNTIGIIRLKPNRRIEAFHSEEIRLIEACINQIANAIEVDYLQDEAKRNQVAANTQHLNHALINSLADDVKTPLSDIIEAAKKLNLDGTNVDKSSIEKIMQQAERINRLFISLSETGVGAHNKLTLNKEKISLNTLIHTSLENLKDALKNYSLNVDIANELPNIPLDKKLIGQVIINLVENALRYSPEGTPIQIKAYAQTDQVMVSIGDRGPGISEVELEKIFLKFYRGSNAKDKEGAGMGLAICRNIIEAHGGKIWAEPKHPSGIDFYFTLPLL